MSKLTPKQKTFCNEYLIDLNATQAAIRAGYSVKTANRIGNENLSKLDIQNRINELIKKRESRTEITQDRVLNELAKLAFANATDYVEVEDMGTYKRVNVTATKDIPKDKIAAIASIKEGTNGIEVKLHDKVKALELVGRHLGMFKDKIELSGETNINITPMTSDERKARIEELKKKLVE